MSNTITSTALPPQQLTWLWRNYVPYGELTLLYGAPGVGKSVLTLFLAARVSTGWIVHAERDQAQAMTQVPRSRHRRSSPGSVLIIAPNNMLTETQILRLKAVDADLARIKTLRDITGEHDELGLLEL